MNTEQAKKLSESALNLLMDALERGQSAALKQYLAVMSRFRRYSWSNVLLIYSQFPRATHVGGFHFWLKLGRHVRRGEKGIAILAPMVGRKRQADDEEVEQDVQTRVFGFKACHVFDRLSRDFRESRVRACIIVKHASLILFGGLTEEGRSPTGVSCPNNAPEKRASRRTMELAFRVQKPQSGASYRIIDPLGFPAGAVNDFLEHLEIRGRSAYTLHSYAIGLADFLGWLRESEIDIDDVTRHVIGQYITEFGNGPRGGIVPEAKPDAKRRPRTVNHRLSVLASFFAFRIRQDDEAGAGPWFQRANPICPITAGPHHGMRGRDAIVRGTASEFRRRVPRRIPVQIDPATAMELIDAARSWRDKSILTLLFRTGQRIGDWNDDTDRHGILGMMPADTDAYRKTITVRLKGARDEHRVPVTDDFWPLLHRYMEEERTGCDSAALWIGLRRAGGTPLTYSSFEASLRYASRKVGVRVHAHMFRHLMAQTVLEVTGNLKVAQDLLGHAQISTTADLYMHADQAAMVSAVAAVKFSIEREATPASRKIGEPLRYAFPYDTTTIEELDKAAASSLLLTGESL